MNTPNIKEQSPLGSVMLFNKQDVKFVDKELSFNNGEQSHDIAQGVDIKLTEDFIRNGRDNYFPYHIIDAVKRSTLQKRAFKTISSVAAGDISFVNPDKTPVKEARLKQLKEIYKNLGLTTKKFLKPAMCQAYLFGSCPTTLSWASTGREFALSTVKTSDYKTFRLGAPTMKNGEVYHDKHFFHRNWGWREETKNRRVRVSDKKTLSWLDWQADQEKNKDNAAFIYSYDADRSLGDKVNRTQSYFIAELDSLTDYYPLPAWFSGAAFNYIKSDWLLSCFDVDEIDNGFQMHGTIKVYHKSYKNPESGEAKDTFAKHKQMIKENYTGGGKSGSLNIVPVGLGGEAVNDTMEFIPTPTSSGRERYELLGDRITNNVLSANGAIYSELFGVRDTKTVLSEGDGKLIVGLKILNQFTIKPLKSMFDADDGGFLNVINDILGIEERAVVVPNLSAFLNIDSNEAMHYLHPSQWFQMWKDFGLEQPTEEQIASGLIPAYNLEGKKTSITVNNG